MRLTALLCLKKIIFFITYIKYIIVKIAVANSIFNIETNTVKKFKGI